MEQKKIKILNEVLGSFHITNDELLFYCPYCRHQKRKMSVNVNKNVFKCWICDSTGKDVRRIVRKFGKFKQLQRWDELTNRVDITKFDDVLFAKQESPEEPTISLPEEFKSLANRATPFTSLAAIKYLTRRDVSTDDIVHWKIGFCNAGDYSNRIVIPSFNSEGKINYFVARTYIENPRRYKNPPVSKDICFNELYIDWDSPLVIAEGIFDAIRAGPNAIPLLGSTLRENSKLFQKIVANDTPVYMALDADASKKESKIISLLLEYGVELYKINTNDYEDVATMPKNVLERRKEKATVITSRDYLLTAKLQNI